MKKSEWAYRKPNGLAMGTQGWEVDKEKASSFTYTGLWRGKKCVALLVGDGFDEGSAKIAETGDFLVEAANRYPVACDLLRRLTDTVEALDGTSVENEKLVDEYRAFFRK